MTNLTTDGDFEAECPRCGLRKLVLTTTTWASMGTASTPDSTGVEVYAVTATGVGHVHLCKARPDEVVDFD